MGRPGLALAFVADLCMFACAAVAAPRNDRPQARADVEGVSDRALRADLVRAIGEERGAPANRIEARRRARAAADNADALLRSDGYYDAVVDPEIGEGDRPRPVVRIDPGPLTHIGRTAIQWTGAAPDAAAERAAQAAVALKVGGPARAVEVLAAQGRIVAILQERGYADAKAKPVVPVVDHADHAMSATFEVAAGGLVRLDGVNLHAKSRTDPRFIHGLAPWKAGEVYKPRDVAELERRLIDTGVYDSVTVAVAPPGEALANGERPVVVSVADRAKHSFSFGAGYSTTEGPDLDTTYSIYNVIDRADTLTFLARAQTIDSRVGVTLSLPDVWSAGQTLRVGPDIFNEVTNAYTTTGAEFVVDLTQRYGKTSFFTKGFSLVASHVDDVELKPVGLNSIDIFSVRPLIDYSRDFTDNPLDSHRGYKIDVRAEPIGIFGDETLFYFKLQSQASTYVSLEKNQNTVLAIRLQVGSIIGGQIPQVPASDRFFAGGGGTVRGYEFQNVGPHYADNTPAGGLSLVDGTVELRRALLGDIGGVLFLDSGAVGSQTTPSFSHIASSVGVGLRYNLGFAPIRADFAFPLNHLSAASQPPIQVYLSIGQSF